jgi:DNA-binding NtrC family response regulator
MKAGAFDFIQKPVEPDQFMHVVRRAIEHGRLVREVQYLREKVNKLRGPTEMIGMSPAIRQVRSLIEKVAPSDATVLITGESGTGKELVALEIHKQSNRASGNLVQVNCAALSDALFESEFFGHRRGAFTSAVEDRRGRFREAKGGTLVLDEIGTLRPEMQAKLLRVLETGEYQVVGESKTRVADVRLIAITNDDLEKNVEEGSFRDDLLYRLNIFPIETPPLRDRREDLAVLANHFLRQCCKNVDEDDSTISDENVALLSSYDWPGNVRELRNLIERATILADSHMPSPEVFRAVLSTSHGSLSKDAKDDGDLQIRSRVEKLEKKLILEALEQTDGRKRDACVLLGIDPKNLSYYMRKHELSDPSGGGEESTSA